MAANDQIVAANWSTWRPYYLAANALLKFFYLYFSVINSGDHNMAAIEPSSAATLGVTANWYK